MLHITVPEKEWFDDRSGMFFTVPSTSIVLEHSLVSISKWESRWHKPFLSKNDKTQEEFLDYIRCMTITQNVNPMCYYGLTDESIEVIGKYINDPMTATTIRDDGRPPSRRIVTSEVVYSWMFALNIPLSCEKWHFNRLMMLIRVCDAQNAPPKKMSKSSAAAQRRQINAARQHQYHTRG